MCIIHLQNLKEFALKIENGEDGFLQVLITCIGNIGSFIHFGDAYNS